MQSSTNAKIGKESDNNDATQAMVQSKKMDSSFLTFHLSSKKRHSSNVAFEKFSSSSSCCSGNNDDETNALLLDCGKTLLFSSSQEEEETVVDMSYTNDHQNLLCELSNHKMTL